MHEVGILEAKTRFSALVNEVEGGGGEVTVTRHGRPVVRIVPAGELRKRKLSGEELAQRFQTLRDRIALECPEEAEFDALAELRAMRNGLSND